MDIVEVNFGALTVGGSKRRNMKPFDLEKYIQCVEIESACATD